MQCPGTGEITVKSIAKNGLYGIITIFLFKCNEIGLCSKRYWFRLPLEEKMMSKETIV